MPPVEMIAVVLPAFSASRTSIHVISSSHTVLARAADSACRRSCRDSRCSRRRPSCARDAGRAAVLRAARPRRRRSRHAAPAPPRPATARRARRRRRAASGGGSVPLLAIALLIASTVCCARNSTIFFASSVAFARSEMSTPLMRRLARLHALVVAHRLRVVDEHVERDDRIVVQVVALAVLDALAFHVARDAAVVVVLLHVRDDRIAVPALRSAFRPRRAGRPGCRRCRR